MLDRRRITPVPPGHWLLLQDERPFRAWLTRQDMATREQVEAIEVQDGYVACFAPRNLERAVDAELEIERYALANEKVEGRRSIPGRRPRPCPRRWPNRRRTPWFC